MPRWWWLGLLAIGTAQTLLIVLWGDKFVVAPILIVLIYLGLRLQRAATDRMRSGSS